MEKQDAFTQALLRAIDAAEQEAGIRQPRLRRAVEQYGGISAVQELCRRGQVSELRPAGRAGEARAVGRGAGRFGKIQRLLYGRRGQSLLCAALRCQLLWKGPLLTTDQKNRWIGGKYPASAARSSLRVSQKQGSSGGIIKSGW